MLDGRGHDLLAKLVMGFICLFFAWTQAQEVKHAPTVEQCRADQKLWSSKQEDINGLILVSFEELTGWQLEMDDCESVDPDHPRRYHDVIAEIDAEKVMRLKKFLDRHGLYDKFIEEDKSGKQ